MLILIVFTSCLLYTISSGQTNTTINHPTLGQVYPVANNDSLLNFTFTYPKNYKFDKLHARFSIYDFIGNDKLNPQIYPFSWVNFTDSNTSLPWVVPNVILQSGDYVIACFEWIQTNNSDHLLLDTNECILTRTAMNSTILPIASPIVSIPILTNTSATISAYYPAVLPYDVFNISSTLNDTILPSTIDSTSNDTYMSINTFTYTNLTSNTYYNLCIYMNYSNSKINESQKFIGQCQFIMTLGGGNSTNTTPPNNSSGNSTSTTPLDNSSGNSTSTTPLDNSSGNNTSATPPNNSSNKNLLNVTFIILFILFYFI